MAFEVHGNIGSLKGSVIQELESIYDMQAGKDEFLSEELANKLVDISYRINREVAVYINRKGKIIDVSVGDYGTVNLGEIEDRQSRRRLSGIRCIHTHPVEAMLSSVDINAMINLRLDGMASIGIVDGKPTEYYVAIPAVNRDTSTEIKRAENEPPGTSPYSIKADIYGPLNIRQMSSSTLMNVVMERDRILGKLSVFSDENDLEEKAILVGVELPGASIISGRSEGERSLEELGELARTAGATVVTSTLQRRGVPDTAFYIGRGKAEELSLLRQSLDANLLIFDDELSGAQVRNLEEITGVKVIDRTALILDIFASRARSNEGKIQVELAQLKYRLPRLMGMGAQMSRLGGGIGTRGPGEKKLEMDRRHIRKKINILENELSEIRKRRQLYRNKREAARLPVIAIVGYTNAGKSTLMNKLCNVDVYAENLLFATLDTTTRKLALPDKREVLLSDTVGFIRKLPHELVEAFKSTLEEVAYADVVLHVVDGSSEEMGEQIQVVENILSGLVTTAKPQLLAINKVDRAEPDISRLPEHYRNKNNVVEISAATGVGLDKLLQELTVLLPSQSREVELLIPYQDGRLLDYLHKNGDVREQVYEESGIRLRVLIKIADMDKFENYIVK